jgi:hypothetical protein
VAGPQCLNIVYAASLTKDAKPLNGMSLRATRLDQETTNAQRGRGSRYWREVRSRIEGRHASEQRQTRGQCSSGAARPRAVQAVLYGQFSSQRSYALQSRGRLTPRPGNHRPAREPPSSCDADLSGVLQTGTFAIDECTLKTQRRPASGTGEKRGNCRSSCLAQCTLRRFWELQ